MIYILQGLTMGLAYVAPIGMQNMFVINSALTRTRRMSYLTALIVIFFDITLSLACYLGMGALINLSLYVKAAILLLGSLLVMFIGINLVRDKGNVDKEVNVDMPLLKLIWRACVVTWFNPQAIIDGTMLLGAFRASLSNYAGPFFLAGVMLASTIWFLGISTILQIIHHKLPNNFIRWINIVCGIIVVAYGVKLLLDFIILVRTTFIA